MNNIITITNQYSLLCNQIIHNKEKNNSQPQNYDNLIITINFLLENNINKIFLLGGCSSTIFNSITKKLINYIREKKENIIIILQIEDNDNFVFSEENKLFLIRNNIFIQFVITNHIQENQIINILNINPFSSFLFIINQNTQNNLFDNFLILNKLSVKKLKFYYDIEEIDLQIYQLEVQKISKFIIESFINNKIPLISENLKTKFFQYFILDYEEKNNIQVFNNFLMLSKQCEFLQNDFDCLNNYDNIRKLKENNLLKFEDYNSNCKECNFSTICEFDCIFNNLKFTSHPYQINKNKCLIHKENFKIALDIIQKLSLEKNLLFKDFFYISVTEGFNYYG